MSLILQFLNDREKREMKDPRHQVPIKYISSCAPFPFLYTTISRKVVGKKVHAVFQKGNMGYDPYTVSDIVAVQPTFAASL